MNFNDFNGKTPVRHKPAILPSKAGTKEQTGSCPPFPSWESYPSPSQNKKNTTKNSWKRYVYHVGLVGARMVDVGVKVGGKISASASLLSLYLAFLNPSFLSFFGC